VPTGGHRLGDGVFEGVAGEPVLLGGLVERARLEDGVEVAAEVAGLGRVGLVDEDGVAAAGVGGDGVRDLGELLDGRDDDLLPALDGGAELAAVGDGGDEALGALELADGLAELLVEEAPVGDDDDGVEDAAVAGVVERGEAVGEPGDGEALAAAGRVLDEVALAGAVGAGVGDEAADGVELVVAREDEGPFAGGLAVVVEDVDLVGDVLDEVEDAVARPRLGPDGPSRRRERLSEHAPAGTEAAGGRA
jgi:hypothetical protein